MLRGAAKNFLRVAAVSNPDRYGKILEELDDNEGALSLETRFRLAQETFAHSRRYEEAIADYLEKVDPKSLSNTYLSAGKA
jgi:phosphoribosylaminoimidazolecarboxamide formyltransferase/IMP cyclohydrolase